MQSIRGLESEIGSHLRGSIEDLRRQRHERHVGPSEKAIETRQRHGVSSFQNADTALQPRQIADRDPVAGRLEGQHAILGPQM